ncbi:MAG: hypothetical protein Q4G27_01600 [Flavobacteriaceae bacterium]|nr:hypothetical protein [Flavobacteriaceae bacterium]
MRKEILDIIVASQTDLVNNLKKSLATYESATDLDEESTIDLDDQSHQADLQDLKMEMNQKLRMEENDLVHIKSLRTREADQIQEGALVETENAFYFVGFAFAPIEYEGKKILGVSLHAPAFAANEGKTKGDEMVLGENKQKIKNIY